MTSDDTLLLAESEHELQDQVEQINRLPNIRLQGSYI